MSCQQFVLQTYFNRIKKKSYLIVYIICIRFHIKKLEIKKKILAE